jgi:hypothetical protein
MTDDRVREIIRLFPENGAKLLLENGDNVRDLLVLARAAAVKWIDFGRMEVVGTTFVQRDYRSVASDLVLKAPLKTKGRGGPRQVVVYILIEHQSEPDEWMPLRVLEYVVEVYKSQVRKGPEGPAALRSGRLQPVLPVVFYTGMRTWEDIGVLSDLIEEGERFADVTPLFRPLFVNVGGMDPGRLVSEGGFFGQVLRVVRERRASGRVFRGVLREAVRRLEEMPKAQQLRWKDLLSYLGALVYHERERAEQPGLYELIETSVATEEHRQEVKVMVWSMADQLKEEGAVEANRRTLLRLLRERFGEVPSHVAATIEMTANLTQLDGWLLRFANAKTLEEIGIAPASEKGKKGKK